MRQTRIVFPALRHKLLTLTTRLKVLRFGKGIGYC